MPDGSLVLVFDDGYAEDHDQLRPILQSHDAPATLASPAVCLGVSTAFAALMLATAVWTVKQPFYET